MKDEKTLVNCQGQVWQIEHYESERLTHVGGYLITYQTRGRVTLSTQLSDDDKTKGKRHLLNLLSKRPTGTNGVLLWHPDDEEQT